MEGYEIQRDIVTGMYYLTRHDDGTKSKFESLLNLIYHIEKDIKDIEAQDFNITNDTVKRS